MLPAGSFLVAVVSWMSFVAAIAFYAFWFATFGEEPPWIFSFLSGLFLELGALAVALGLASVLSGYRYKALSILGILGGLGILITTIYLIFS